MKKKQNACCEYCDNLIAIGEGDHICLEVTSDKGEPAIMPISDYSPTDEYLKCGGKKFEPA